VTVRRTALQHHRGTILGALHLHHASPVAWPVLDSPAPCRQRDRASRICNTSTAPPNQRRRPSLSNPKFPHHQLPREQERGWEPTPYAPWLWLEEHIIHRQPDDPPPTTFLWA
jgi:hypothetical protein